MFDPQKIEVGKNKTSLCGAAVQLDQTVSEVTLFQYVYDLMSDFPKLQFNVKVKTRNIVKLQNPNSTSKRF